MLEVKMWMVWLALTGAYAGQWATCLKAAGVDIDLAAFRASSSFAEDAAKRDELRMSSTAYVNPFPNGAVRVILRRTKIDGADAAHHAYIWVDAAGQKVEEIQGQHTDVSAPPAPGTLFGEAVHWWTGDLVPLPSNDAGLTLHIVDLWNTDKCVFEVTRKGKAGMKLVGYVK